MKHIMLDLETLGTKPGCAIVSVGACEFDLTGIKSEFYNTVDQRWHPAGASIEAGTVAWWTEQSAEARSVFFLGPRVHYNSVLYNFGQFALKNVPLQQVEPVFLWGHGAAFDAPILEAYYRMADLDMGIPFYNWRDTRTLYALAGVKPIREGGTHHNALDDAKAQALAVIEACKKLNVELA